MNPIRTLFLLGMMSALGYSFIGATVKAETCGDELVKRPGVVRTTLGGAATFSWETSNISVYHRIRCETGSQLVITFLPPKDRITPHISRANGVFNGNGFGFNLTNVADLDVENNLTCEFLRVNGTKCEEMSTIFLYKKPTKPEIHLSYPSTEKECYTLTCQANSSSIPVDYRLPILYTWATTADTETVDLGYTMTGIQNETLSLVNRDVTKSYAVDVTCHATEQGSSLSSEETEHVEIEATEIDSNSTMSESGEQMIEDIVIIAGAVGAVIAFILIILTIVVCYLCWERKHRPERSRRRRETFSRSMTLPGIRRSRHRLGLSIESADSEPEIYQSIRNSAIRSTFEPQMTVPTLPKRPSPLGATAGSNQGVYDYADPLRVNGRTDHTVARRLLADGKDNPEDFTYGGATLGREIDAAIKKDVDIYMSGAGGGIKKRDKEEPAKMDVYATVNKARKKKNSASGGDSEEEETALVDNDVYHTNVMGDSPVEFPAKTDDVTMLRRNRKPGNEYTDSPTISGVKPSVKSSELECDSVHLGKNPSVDVSIGIGPEKDLYCLAQSTSKSNQESKMPKENGVYELAQNEDPLMTSPNDQDIYSLSHEQEGAPIHDQVEPRREDIVYEMASAGNDVTVENVDLANS